MEKNNLDIKLDYIAEDVKEIKERLKSDFVSTSEFLPVRNIVYGQVALILTAVIGALIALVIQKQ